MSRAASIRPFLSLAAALTVGVVSGCGGPSDQPDLGTVTGVVKLDGQPLPGATVTFTPESGRSSSGVTDEAGRYELQYTMEAKGAKIGPHTVTITTLQAGTGGEGGEGGEQAAVPEKVPARYNQGGALTATVKEGENTIDFDLQSAGA